MTMKAIAFPVTGDILILEEPTPIRTEMFLYTLKVISQEKLVLISSGPKPSQKNVSLSIKEPPVFSFNLSSLGEMRV